MYQINATLESFRELAHNWDDAGSAAPNAVAIALGYTVIAALADTPLSYTIAPCSDEGVTFLFMRPGRKYAAIECYNTGVVMAVMSVSDGNPEVWAVNMERGGLSIMVEKIVKFFADRS